MTEENLAEVARPERLAAVAASGLLQGPSNLPGLERLVQLASTLLDAPLAFFTVVDAQRSWYKATVGVPPEVISGEVEASFCKYVIGSGQALVVGDAANDLRTRDNPAIESMGVAAWAGYPVRLPGGELLGSFCVVDTKVHAWSDRDVELLGILAAAAADEVKHHLVSRAEEQARRVIDNHVRELSQLRERQRSLLTMMQLSLLPPAIPAVDGLDVAVRYESANDTTDLGGDWYDVISLPDGRAGFVVADVAGHDAGAVAVMAQLRHSLHVYAREGDSPSVVLHRLHDLMRDLDVQRFVTIFYGIWDPTRSSIRFQSAGHPPAIRTSRDGAQLCQAGRTSLLGVPTVTPGTAEDDVTLHPGEMLVIFTDGLFERRDQTLDNSLHALTSIVAADRDLDTAAATADALMTTCRPDAGWDDDVALMVLRSTPQTSSPS